MKSEELSDELREKVASCKTPEDLLALAKQEGYELSDEELTAIAGGAVVLDGPCSEVQYRSW